MLRDHGSYTKTEQNKCLYYALPACAFRTSPSCGQAGIVEGTAIQDLHLLMPCGNALEDHSLWHKAR